MGRFGDDPRLVFWLLMFDDATAESRLCSIPRMSPGASLNGYLLPSNRHWSHILIDLHDALWVCHTPMLRCAWLRPAIPTWLLRTMLNSPPILAIVRRIRTILATAVVATIWWLVVFDQS